MQSELLLTEAHARAYNRDARSYLSWFSYGRKRAAELRRLRLEAEVSELWGAK